MASETSNTGGWFKKRGSKSQTPIRVLTAAATRLDLKDAQGARQQRAMRQGWQSDAWSYRDSIGELRYAIQFLANCTARMRLYPAAYAVGGDTDNPIPLAEIAGVPPEVVAACNQAMLELGNGRLAISGLLHSLSTNTTVAGECYLLGQQDGATGRETWTIRSIDEIVIKDDKYQVRDVPSDPQGVIPWETLDPDKSVVSRIWTPHPRFRLLADSPLRAIMDDCEALLILRRMIRATGRSRLAGRGLLLIPDELTIKVPDDDNADPAADPFLAALTEAMTAPIADEGVASAVVPIVVRGPGETLAKVQHIDFASSFDKDSHSVRDELIGVIATGLDIPKEVIVGVADLNHWTAWQVDDNTFRHHVEPHVIACCDSMTSAYLRPYLEAQGIDPEWVLRCAFWYDPTELVTHPDQTADAMQLHDRLVISDEALLKVSGFTEDSKPTKQEIQVRLLHAMRNWPPNLVMAFLHAWDPTLIAPPIETAGTIPGIAPGGVDVGTPPPTAILPGAPTPTAPPTSPVVPDPAPAVAAPPTPPPGAPVVAAGKSAKQPAARLSKKLTTIDRDLRVRLQTAANAAMLRQLERAGAKMRTKVAKDETMRSKIAQRPNERVPAILGEEVVLAAGLSAQELMGGDWSSLKSQFYEWTEAAQKQALRVAIQIGGIADGDDAIATAEAAMSSGRDAGWKLLSDSLTTLGQHLLYNPDPNAGPAEWADLNPDTLVPTGMVRIAMATAGGADVSTVVPYTDALGTPVGQIGTGATIRDLLLSSDAEQDRYEWVHGPALNPFEPHEDLDGVTFPNFDDEQLANNSGWPGNEFFFPGDHDGCLCDFTPLWVVPSE